MLVHKNVPCHSKLWQYSDIPSFGHLRAAASHNTCEFPCWSLTMFNFHLCYSLPLPLLGQTVYSLRPQSAPRSVYSVSYIVDTQKVFIDFVELSSA